MFPCAFFKLSDGSLENNTLLVASLDLALQGSLVLCLEIFPQRLRPGPPFGPALLPGIPDPWGPAHATVGTWRIPSWGRVSASAFHSDSPPLPPPFRVACSPSGQLFKL